MQMLKKLFPMAFTAKTDFATLIVDIIIHLLAIGLCIIFGDLMINLGKTGIIFRVIFYGLDVYLGISMIMAILNYFKVVK